MRQIAEFVAVLSCSLFTGASVYITFIEHPARMQCGVEIAATEFPPRLPPSYCHAGNLRSLGSAVVSSSVAHRGDILVARWRGGVRRCYPIHSDRDTANEPAIAEPHAGQTISRNGAATRPLGEIACREKRAERRGASAVPVLGDLHQGASVRS